MKKRRRKVMLEFCGGAFDGYQYRVKDADVPEIQALHAEHTCHILHWYIATQRVGFRQYMDHSHVELLNRTETAK